MKIRRNEDIVFKKNKKREITSLFHGTAVYKFIKNCIVLSISFAVIFGLFAYIADNLILKQLFIIIVVFMAIIDFYTYYQMVRITRLLVILATESEFNDSQKKYIAHWVSVYNEYYISNWYVRNTYQETVNSGLWRSEISEDALHGDNFISNNTYNLKIEHLFY